MSDQKRYTEFEFQEVPVPLSLSASYIHLNKDSQLPLIILFHGFQDTAAAMIKRFWGSDVEAPVYKKFELFALNGFFPVPIQTDNEWKASYAWYFVDSKRRISVVSPDVAISGISNVINGLFSSDRPKILVGFSQGGFLIPLLSGKIENIKRAICAGSAYKTEDFSKQLCFPVDAIHGTMDKVISYERARISFDEISSRNPKGKFYEFEGLDHNMNEESRSQFIKLVNTETSTW